MENKNKDKINFIGKIAHFPKNSKASSAYKFLENIKISKNKLWYFIIEKEVILKENNKYEELQLIKYNNKQGINCYDFINSLKEYYKDNEIIFKYINELKIDGSDSFSIIRNIPNIEIDGKKLITILTESIIKILYS